MILCFWTTLIARGILSADGHEWATTAIATDYMEKSFAGFPRSYPDGWMTTTWTRWPIRRKVLSGTIAWRTAKRCGTTGNSPSRASSGGTKRARGKPKFLDHYNEFINGTDTIEMHSDPGVESLRPLFGRQLHRLGPGRAGRATRGDLHRRTQRVRDATEIFPISSSSACPTIIPAEPVPAPPPRPRKWPTTTWPLGRLSRP